MTDHPYKAYEKTATWKEVEKAIEALVRNGDLVEQTPRHYIVGFITQSIFRRRLKSSKLASKRRIFARAASVVREAEMALVEMEADSPAK